MNTIKAPPIRGISVDSPGTCRIDDIFWVYKSSDTEYVLQICIPVHDESNIRFKYGQHPHGLVFDTPVPAFCYQFRIQLSDTHSMRILSFDVFECRACNIAAVQYHGDMLLGNLGPNAAGDILAMLVHARTVALAARNMFCAMGIIIKYDSSAIGYADIVHHFMVLVNICVANIAVQNIVPMIFSKLSLRSPRTYDAGCMRLWPYYTHVTSPYLVVDIINQCNFSAFLKNKEYPLDHECLRSMDVLSKHPIEISTCVPIQEKAVPVEFVAKEVRINGTGFTLHQVSSEDYASALKISFAKANLPVPVYSFSHRRSKGLPPSIICHVTVQDPLSRKDIFAIGISSTDKQAQRIADKKMYDLLIKKTAP
jgi:hypothetical protein